MKQGKTGCLWEAGDKVCILRAALEEPHRSNRRLLVYHRLCEGEVTAIDDARRKIQVALRIKGRSFVIGVGEMLPKAWVDSEDLSTNDAREALGADPDEQFDPQPWLTNITHKVLVEKDIRLPSGIVLFEAGFIYSGRKADLPEWDTYGYELFCPATRKFHFCDREVTSLKAEEIKS